MSAKTNVASINLAEGRVRAVVERVLRWRRTGAARWESTAMAALGKDRRRADFVVDALGAWPG